MTVICNQFEISQVTSLRENLQKYSLSRNQHFSILITAYTIMNHCDFPDTLLRLPFGSRDLSVELNVSIKVPFFHCLCDVFLNFGARSVEVTPIWIWVKWEGLQE